MQCSDKTGNFDLNSVKDNETQIDLDKNKNKFMNLVFYFVIINILIAFYFQCYNVQ